MRVLDVAVFLPERTAARYPQCMAATYSPELVVGLVGAVGSPMEEATQAIQAALERLGYRHEVIRLSSWIAETPAGRLLEEKDEYHRLKSAMTAGTWLREKTGRGDALLALAVAQMSRFRAAAAGQRSTDTEVAPAIDKHCFILRSLKHEHEVARLRALYRDQFLLLGVYSSRSRRLAALADRIANSVGGRAEQQRARAEELIAIDADEPGTDLGQSVGDTFPLADAFVTADRLREDVDRVFNLFFRAPYVTPTRDEQGMFFAQAAALRSAALGRQVGACIARADGDVLAVGCNEVPRSGGGQYWPGDEPDGRDFAEGYDRNDRLKQRVVRELLTELKAKNWITGDASTRPLDELTRDVMSRSPGDNVPRLRYTQIGALTEFGRDVHAEMAALTTLARMPVSGRGAHLFTTTFPCHNCAKHILAAGIERVVYIEPYAKSFAEEFHPDAIAPEGVYEKSQSGKLLMQPFGGIAPRRYLEWFTAGRRKDELGRVVSWPGTNPQPVFVEPQHGGFDQARLDAEAPFIKDVLELLDSLEHTEHKDSPR